MPRSSRGSTSSGRTSSGGRSTRGGTTTTTRKKDESFFSHWGPIPLVRFGDWRSINPWYTAAKAAEAAGAPRGVRYPLGAIAGVGGSPFEMARHPHRSITQAEEMLLGLVEAPYGIYQMRTGGKGFRNYGKGMSWQDIGSLMLKSVTDDY